MDQKQAEMLATAVGGDSWQTGGGIWVVTFHRAGGGFVVFSGDAVCEYKDEAAFEDGGPALATIELGLDEGRWVIQDDAGNVFYEHDELELGWRNQHDAEREARCLELREGGKYWVREQ